MVKTKSLLEVVCNKPKENYLFILNLDRSFIKKFSYLFHHDKDNENLLISFSVGIDIENSKLNSSGANPGQVLKHT